MELGGANERHFPYHNSWAWGLLHWFVLPAPIRNQRGRSEWVRPCYTPLRRRPFNNAQS